MRHLTRVVAVVLAVLTITQVASAKKWYVSAERGKGKTGSIEEPAKDLGNILTKLEDGDQIFITEGVYLGRGESGSTQVTVACEIYGGFSQDFKDRDPWGEHKTIFSGANESKNYESTYRLSVDLSKRRDLKEHKVIVDGIIFDNGDRNFYSTDEQLKIVRMASPAQGKNPSPESGGLSVAVWKLGDIVVRNCIVMNTAPTGGAFSIWGHEASKVEVRNNLAINNTGDGFYLHTAFHGDPAPQFTFQYNTSIFNEKHDPIATYGGSGLKLESGTKVTATNNFFGFNDYYGVDNAKRSEAIVLNENFFVGNMIADYIEFDTKIALEDIEDEADLLDEAEGNEGKLIKMPVSAEWAAKWNARNVIDRAAAEAEVQPKTSSANALRAMLGLNQEGTDLKMDSDVWLPRMTLDEAMGVAGNLGQWGTRRLVGSKKDE